MEHLMGARNPYKGTETQFEGVKRINELLDEAQSLVYEAEAIADELGLSFTVNFGTYGMGGSYTGAAAVEDWQRSDNDDAEDVGLWNASSQSC